MAILKYKDIEKELSLNDRILIDDGNIELIVTDISSDKITTIVKQGGILKPRKGVNLPSTKLSTPALTEKDLTDLLFGIENDVDYIALSFVRSVDDINTLRKTLDEHNSVTNSFLGSESTSCALFLKILFILFLSFLSSFLNPIILNLIFGSFISIAAFNRFSSPCHLWRAPA